MMESSWFSTQIELLDRQKLKTRLELANAIFGYIRSATTANAATPR